MTLGAVHKLRLQEEGVGGQKKPNLVNVVCERPPREALVKAGHSGTIGLELSSALDSHHSKILKDGWGKIHSQFCF